MTRDESNLQIQSLNFEYLDYVEQLQSFEFILLKLKAVSVSMTKKNK